MRDRRRRVAVLRRGVWLILLGLLLNIVAAAPHVVAMRWPGVLQRIGLVYLLAAPIVMRVRPGWRIAAIAVLVLGHWTLLTAHMAGAAGLEPDHNLAGAVDRAVFGGHLLTPTGDPEGLLGTIPAVGKRAARIDRRRMAAERPFARPIRSWLAAAGVGLIAGRSAVVGGACR